MGWEGTRPAGTCWGEDVRVETVGEGLSGCCVWAWCSGDVIEVWCCIVVVFYLTEVDGSCWYSHWARYLRAVATCSQLPGLELMGEVIEDECEPAICIFRDGLHHGELVGADGFNL